MKLVFRHPDMPPSLNGNNGLLRMHWTKRKSIKEKFHYLIKNQKPKKIEDKCILTMVNYYIMPSDWDNMISRLKIIADVLVDMEIIKDDNPSVIIDFIPKQVRVCKKLDVRLEFIFSSV